MAAHFKRHGRERGSRLRSHLRDHGRGATEILLYGSAHHPHLSHCESESFDFGDGHSLIDQRNAYDSEASFWSRGAGDAPLRGIPHGFDEKRSNVNYWEPWYLGYDPKRKEQREKGIPNEKKPRTGLYARMIRESSESEGHVGPSCNLSEE